MIEIIDVTGVRDWKVLATVSSFTEAMNAVEDMGCLFMESILDYEEYAGAYMKDGRIITIRPVSPNMEGGIQ